MINVAKVFFGVLLLALSGGLSYYFVWKPAPSALAPDPDPSVPKRTVSDPKHCAEILAGNSFDNIRNRLNRLESRAIPNERLVRAFGINNAFTTTNGDYARAFKAAAVKKIKMGDSDWERIAAFAQRLVIESVTSSKSDHLDANLDSLVQSIALKLALHVLFGLDPFELDKDAIKRLAEGINNCWVYSKSSTTTAAENLGITKVTVNEALTNLFPDINPSSSKENPLNFILPAYETLWRIVLLCFIEVSFRQNRQAETIVWRNVLETFLTNPTHAAFEKSGTTEAGKSVSVSASHLVSEGLRLYPPTRRIYRMYHLEDSSSIPEILAADIEKMQRDPQVWENPLTFKPSRWLNINEEAQSAFMPFGNNPFICPARKEFGPRMIGILVAALACHINPKGLELWKNRAGDAESTLGNDEEIFTDRDMYEHWWLQKKLN